MMRIARRVPLFVLASSLLIPTASEGAPLKEHRFELIRAAEVIATVTASCGGCDWGRVGREAAVLRLDLDGQYSQHLILTRGPAPVSYRVMLGPVAAGAHRLSVSHDTGAWSKAPNTGVVERVDIQSVDPSHAEHAALSLAPLLYARPNTIGRFSDVPLAMWYETDRTERGSRLRYSVIFSNEDGGTPADRLLATWGRLTDIEYVYGIELDQGGRVLEETFQGKDHEIVPFKGQREGRHPLLYVVTDNNMVKDSGDAVPRFAPAPVAFDLTNVSREAVMDSEPWTYAVTAQEARREGRAVKAPTPGSKKIVDPARYAVVELCTASDDTTFATFTFSLGVRDGSGPLRYFDSTTGVREYRISRSPDNFPNSCFRGATALPKDVKPDAVAALQVRAHLRPPKKGDPSPKGPRGPAHLRRVNKVFLMGAGDVPQANLFTWTGDAALPLDGDPVTLDIKAPAAQK